MAPPNFGQPSPVVSVILDDGEPDPDPQTAVLAADGKLGPVATRSFA